MNKPRGADPDIAPEYDFSPGQRGVYLDRAKRGIRVIARWPHRWPAQTSLRSRPNRLSSRRDPRVPDFIGRVDGRIGSIAAGPWLEVFARLNNGEPQPDTARATHPRRRVADAAP